MGISCVRFIVLPSIDVKQCGFGILQVGENQQSEKSWGVLEYYCQQSRERRSMLTGVVSQVPSRFPSNLHEAITSSERNLDPAFFV